MALRISVREILDTPSRRSSKEIGDSAHLPASGLHVVEHLDQERVAVREDRIEVDRGQHLATVEAETRRTVVGGQSQHASGRTCWPRGSAGCDAA